MKAPTAAGLASRSALRLDSLKLYTLGAWVAVVLGWLVVRAPLLAVGAAAAAVIVVVARTKPALVLALGAAGTLAAGEFGVAVTAGSAILALGGITAAVELVAARRPTSIWLLIALITLGWLTLRSMGGDIDVVRPVAACVGGVVLAAYVVQRRADWVPSFALIGLLFLAATVMLGTADPTGLRFEGISGNPNRMVYAVLIFSGPIAAMLTRRVRLTASLVLTTGLLVAVLLILRSGSDQGVAGIALIGGAGALFWTRRIRRSSVVLILALVAAVVGTWVATTQVINTLSPDVLTLSGRTELYSVAWREFLANPWIGTGSLRVSEGAVINRSAHNSILGFAAATGIVGASLWLTLVVRATTSSVLSLRRGRLGGVVGLVVVVSQLVQAVELLPATWILLTLSCIQEDENV